jgi:hypothetical protein
MYVEGVGQKSGPCTATFNDLLCFIYDLSQNTDHVRSSTVTDLLPENGMLYKQHSLSSGI